MSAKLSGGLERFPIRWSHLIEKESLKFNELEHVLIEKVDQLFRNMLYARPENKAAQPTISTETDRNRWPSARFKPSRSSFSFENIPFPL
jgi:hypothetical protein